MEGDKAHNTFSVTLLRLRKLLGHEILPLQNQRLTLDKAACWVDSQSFADLLSSASASAEAGDEVEAWDHSQGALNLYSGPYLDGEFDPPEIMGAHEKLHSQFRRHIEEIGGYFLGAGLLEKAVILYQRGLEIDNLAEEFYQNLMRCYLDQNRYAEGIAVYQSCSQIFHANDIHHLSPETEQLHQALRKAGQESPPDAEPASLPDTHPSRRSAPPVALEERSQEYTDPFASEGERRPATIAFMDLSGFTAMNEQLDPEEVQQIMDEILGRARQIVERHDGIVNQFIGDEVMALFGVPKAEEDDPQRAVRAALELHEIVRAMSPELEARGIKPMRMHTGISRGLVLMNKGGEHSGRYGLYGSAISLGARLVAEAKADQILVSPAIYRSITPFFNTRPLKAVKLKGISQPIVPYLVDSESGISDRFEATLQKGSTPYIGRIKEHALLQDCLTTSFAGEGQFVTVVGEAGVGKSRLLYEFRNNLRQQPITFLKGRCRLHGQDTPYLPYIDALRHGLLLPEHQSAENLHDRAVKNILAISPKLEQYLPVILHILSIESRDYPLSADVQGEELQRAVGRALAAMILLNLERAPMMILLEDWHWCDEASMVITKGLIRHIEQHAILVVITHRPQFEPSWGNLPHHTQLRMRPFSSRETESMIEAVIEAKKLPQGLAERIHSRASGNPFFIEEICHALLEDQSITVQDGAPVLTRALDKITIPDSVQTIIRTRVDRLSPEEREMLRWAGTIGEKFSSEVLLRVCAPELNVPKVLDSLLQLEVIRQARFFPEPEYHFNHAVTQMVVYETMLLQQRKSQHDRVARAIEKLYAATTDEHVEALAFHYGNGTNSEKALYYYELAGDKAARYYSLAEARKQYWGAVSLLRSQHDGTDKRAKWIGITLKLAKVSFFAPSTEHLSALEESLQYATELKNETLRRDVLFCLGFMHYGMGNMTAGLDMFDQCLETGAITPELQAMITNYIGRINFYLANFSRATEYLKKGMGLLGSLEQSVEFGNSAGVLTLVFGFSGEFDRGAALIDNVFDPEKIAPYPNLVTLREVCLGVMNSIQGNWDDALHAFQDARANSHLAANPILGGIAIWGEGYCRSFMENTDAAFSLMREGIQAIETANSRLSTSVCYGLLAERYAERGKGKQATTLANKALKLTKSGGDRLGSYSASRALAIVRAPTDWSKARAHIEQSIQLAEREGSHPNVAIGLLRYAELLRENGDVDSVTERLAKATKLLRKMKMSWWLKEAQKLQQSIGHS